MGVMEQVIKFIAGFFDFFRRPFNNGGTDEPHPTISFHTAHGSNIYLDATRSSVSRTTSYNNGIVFSQRPINVNEIIPVKIVDVRKYKGPLFFGFTSIDPGTLRMNEIRSLRSPALADSDTGSSLVWMKGLHHHEMKVDMILCYQLLASGVVRYWVNGVEYATRLRGLSTNVPLWATFDVYGSSGGIKLINVPVQLQVLGSETVSQSHQTTFTSPVLRNRGFPPTGTLRIDLMNFSSDQSTPPNLPALEERVLQTPLSLPESSEAESNKKCIICVDQNATTAFFKCGHLCLCYPCASRFIDRSNSAGTDRKIYSCPVCRRPVLDIMRVYFS